MSVRVAVEGRTEMARVEGQSNWINRMKEREMIACLPTNALNTAVPIVARSINIYQHDHQGSKWSAEDRTGLASQVESQV